MSQSRKESARKNKWATKKKLLGCSIPILIMVYHNPHISGQYNPLYTRSNQGFFINQTGAILQILPLLFGWNPATSPSWALVVDHFIHVYPFFFGTTRFSSTIPGDYSTVASIFFHVTVASIFFHQYSTSHILAPPQFTAAHAALKNDGKSRRCCRSGKTCTHDTCSIHFNHSIVIHFLNPFWSILIHSKSKMNPFWSPLLETLLHKFCFTPSVTFSFQTHRGFPQLGTQLQRRPFRIEVFIVVVAQAEGFSSAKPLTYQAGWSAARVRFKFL